MAFVTPPLTHDASYLTAVVENRFDGKVQRLHHCTTAASLTDQKCPVCQQDWWTVPVWLSLKLNIEGPTLIQILLYLNCLCANLAYGLPELNKLTY